MSDDSARIYVDRLRFSQKLRRAGWVVVRAIFFTSLPGPLFRYWRIWLLRMFGAKIGRGCRVDSSCRVWWPANLKMADYSCLADSVDCYNVAEIRIGRNTTISQRAFLCTASHATTSIAKPLVCAPIEIRRHAWVAAEAFVGPGVTIGEGAILAARGVAVRDLDAWMIYAGVPAHAIKKRVLTEAGDGGMANSAGDIVR